MKYLILFIFVFSLTGCALFWSETSWRYVVQPKVEQTRIENIDYIRVRGLLMSSSNSIKSSKIKNISEKEIWIHVKEGLVSKNNKSGNFDLLIPITERTEVIYFGSEKVVIWSRK
jgi:hypothetical protein